MIADGNDQPIGFVELVLDPALWVNQIAAIAGCAAALYDVNHRRFTYQQTPELFGKLEPILLPEDSTRPAVTAQIGDSHYLSTCLPLRSPDGGLVSTLWLTRDNTVQANGQRRNLLIGSALLVEGINGKVQGGLKNVRDTAGEFQEVVCGSRKLAELISGIAASSAQQAQGIDQINTAVSRIEQVTQKNATEAESSAAVATEMDAEAGDTIVGERAVAPHQIVLFYKQSCSHCQAAREKLTTLVKRHESAVHLILKDVQRLADVDRTRLKEQISKLPSVFVNGKHSAGWEVPGFLERFTLDCGC